MKTERHEGGESYSMGERVEFYLTKKVSSILTKLWGISSVG